MLETYEQHSRRKLTATVLAVIVIAGAVLLVDYVKAHGGTTIAPQSQNSSLATTTTATQTNSPATTATTSADTATSNSGYKDGTFVASNEYFVPHGSESIQVSVTLKDGVITNSSITNSENDPESADFQENFAASYKRGVVGKKISSLQLNTIAGASDTTQGFNDALDQIASKAQV